MLKRIPWVMIIITGALFLYFKEDIMSFLQDKAPSVSKLLTKNN